MSLPVRAKVAIFLSVAIPTVIDAVFLAKVGVGGIAVYPLLALYFVPSAIGIGLAWMTRKRTVLGWIVLLAVAAVSADGIWGLYNGFFRTPAKGGQDVVYRPFEQIYFMIGVTVIVGLSAILGKFGRSRTKEGG